MRVPHSTSFIPRGFRCCAAAARAAGAQVPVARSRRRSPSPSLSLSRASRRLLASGLALLAALSSSGGALAADWGGEGAEPLEPAPAAPEAPRKGWLVGAALHTPLSLGILSEDDVNQAALMMAGIDADLSLGHGIFKSTRLAYELTVGVRSTLGVVDRFRLEPSDPQAPEKIDDSLTYLLPLGLCIDWLPEGPSGWFGSAHLGLGTFNEPDFMGTGNIELAGRAAVDFGWVMPLGASSLMLSARYSLLGLKRVYIDEDYNDALQLHELSFGVAWLQ